MKHLCLVLAIIALSPSRICAQVATPIQAPALIPLEVHPPAYPLSAQKARLRGEVTVRLSILPSGVVSTATVLGGLLPLLDNASTAAAARWRYAPVSDSVVRTTDVVFEFRTTDSAIQYLCDVSTVTFFPPARVRVLGTTFLDFTK